MWDTIRRRQTCALKRKNIQSERLNGLSYLSPLYHVFSQTVYNWLELEIGIVGLSPMLSTNQKLLSEKRLKINQRFRREQVWDSIIIQEIKHKKMSYHASLKHLSTETHKHNSLTSTEHPQITLLKQKFAHKKQCLCWVLLPIIYLGEKLVKYQTHWIILSFSCVLLPKIDYNKSR